MAWAPPFAWDRDSSAPDENAPGQAPRLGLFPVDRSLTPVWLPGGLEPIELPSVAPAGLGSVQGLDRCLPNDEGLPAGTQAEAWAIVPVDGRPRGRLGEDTLRAMSPAPSPPQPWPPALPCPPHGRGGRRSRALAHGSAPGVKSSAPRPNR